MSQAMFISVTKDDASKAVARLIASTSPRALGEVIWPPCLELTRRHLAAYKNKKNFPSQGFGEQLADKSYGTSTDYGAQIVIHGQGARQLYEGGTITAKNKKMLCFGVTAESYGKSLPEMFGGAIPPRKQRTPEDKAKLKSLRTMFAFAKSVTTMPHPDLLPTHEELRETAVKALKLALKGGFHA
jgi:hypothetical protein